MLNIKGVCKMKITKGKLIKKAKKAKKESRYIEFKEKFDVNSSQDWCEIIKDIVAIANSGNGCIIFGVKKDGSPSGYDLSSISSLDPAIITDKIAKYTGQQFSEFEIEESERDGYKIVILIIYGVSIPMVFTKPGTYSTGNGKQKTAFRRGTIYFRHGAKSEPGDSNDLIKVIEREIKERRKSWLGNIKKVVNAPTGHKVYIFPPNVKISTEPGATPIRITNKKQAPAYRLETPDLTHPYRQKEVIENVNRRLKGKKVINQYDILCVRRVYRINDSRPDFYYKSKYGVPQYSKEFIEWLVRSYKENSSFFDEARKKYKKLKR